MEKIYSVCPCCGQVIEISISLPTENSVGIKDIYPNEVSPSYLEKYGYYFGVTEEVNAK